MKKLIFTLALGALALGAQASTTVDLQGTTFTVDTLAHYYISPGVTHTHLVFKTATRQFQAYVHDMDRSVAEPAGVSAKVEIGKDKCQTAEAMTAMAKRKTTADMQYLAGVNGDFFITSSFAAQHEFGTAILGYPNMSCATDGKLAAPDLIDKTSRENALIIGSDGMWIDETALTYRIRNTGTDIKIDAAGINYPRRANEIMIYNSYMGTTTGTDASGYEIICEPRKTTEADADWHWVMNEPFYFVVKEVRQGGNSTIPADGCVISVGPNWAGAKAAYREWTDALKAGDELGLRLICKLPAFENITPDIREILGGDVRILKENVTNKQANRFINTPTAQYSRSLVGYSQDRNHIVMCCVDAGVSNSSGVTYYEAADVMRALGCWDALDLDGGGSTAMWNHSHGIVNNLRDGSERAVGNAFYFRLAAPADKEIASIRFADWSRTLPKYGLYRPTVYGYNKYGQLVDTDVKGYTLEAPEALGSVQPDGSALLSSGEGTHALTARLGDMTASIAVTVDAAYPAAPRVADVLIDNARKWQVELQAPVGNEYMAVAPMAYSWTSADAAVAEITADGTISGKADGNTTVTGVVGSQTASVNVTVECPKAPVASIAGATTADNWKSSGTSTKSWVLTPAGDDSGFNLEFAVSSTRGPSATVTYVDGKRIWSLPDALELTYEPGTAPITAIEVSMQPKNEAKPVAVSRDVALQGTQTLKFDMSDYGDPSAIDFYPVTFTKIKFTVDGKTGTYNLKVPAIKAVYNNYGAGVGDIAVAGKDTNAALRCVVNGRTISVGFDARSIEVYDAQGRLVATGSGHSVTVPAARGLLIVRADARTAKALLR